MWSDLCTHISVRAAGFPHTHIYRGEDPVKDVPTLTAFLPSGVFVYIVIDACIALFCAYIC